ncbi:MAG: hypothetical protein U0270_16320 [Labilithrix sp.]
MKRYRFALLCIAACGGASEPAPAPAAPMGVGSAPPPPAPCEDDYQLASAPSGAKPDLPPVPALPDAPRKVGESYTVFGAVHALRSRYEEKDVTRASISIVGWIVDSNIPRAPKCAWHKAGVRDPDTCIAELPAFVIADSKDTRPDDPSLPHIKVLGWAKNWATVFEATASYRGGPPKELYRDEMWSVEVPYPLPAAGTKVKVTGRYGYSFTKSSWGLITDPKNGVLTYEKLEVVP